MKNNTSLLIKRHLMRVNAKGKKLEKKHDAVLLKINKLHIKIELIKKTYGWLKCMLSGYLKSQINRFKSMIKSLKNHGRKILNILETWQRHAVLPFA